MRSYYVLEQVTLVFRLAHDKNHLNFIWVASDPN